MQKILLLVALLCATSASSAQQFITIGRSNGVMGTLAEAVLREAYQQLNIELRVRELPAERALNEANRGTTDGDMTRIAGLEARYPNLLRIPVAVNQIEGMVFTSGTDIKVTGWESLRPYRIGVRIGIKFAEDGTRGMNVQPVATNELLFSKLELGRTDIIVASRIEGQVLMKRLNTRKVRPVEPPLTTISLYHYVHRRHQALVPRLTRVLQAMEQSGRIKAIRESALNTMLAEAAPALSPVDK